MNINYFREFLVLADCSNYMEAADRLFINQSNLSKHIISMEKELGVQLFDRTSRKVVLTRFGNLMIPYAQAISSAQVDYESAINNEREAMRGRVTVGTISGISQYHISEILQAYEESVKNGYIRLLENDTKDMILQVRQGKYDAAFAMLPDDTPIPDGMEYIPYLRDTLLAIFPVDHPLAAQEIIHLNQLKDETFILMTEDTPLYTMTVNACKSAGFSPKISYICQRIDSVLDLVTKGMGISLLTRGHTLTPPDCDPLDTPAFVTRPITPAINTKLGLYYRSDYELTPAARHFVKCVRETIEAGMKVPELER
ncbi:MAG: LysR family transcriptional regulator [Clostridiales bacterium]|nr:LysR family transcriptional regulator [Clostridiales bacterium]